MYTKLENHIVFVILCNMLTPELSLKAANATGITILGRVFDYISGMSSQGKRWGTHQLIYVAEGLDQRILSKEACHRITLLPLCCLDG